MDISAPFSILLGLLAVVFIIIGIREVIMWYWKINRIVKLLENIEENTSKLLRKNKDKNSDIE
ncbi:MAG: hypothetical protein PHF35_00200 [Candidatus Moranbacteria bacterium]|nr:hypothetical protein [Candidatus Moranbacteria bacterium]